MRMLQRTPLSLLFVQASAWTSMLSAHGSKAWYQCFMSAVLWTLRLGVTLPVPGPVLCRHVSTVPLLSPGRGVTLPTSGAAFYMDPLVNINGSLNHSPGARAAAAMAALPYDGYGAQTWWAGGGYDNTDVILFGGLTAVNKSESFPSGEGCSRYTMHTVAINAASSTCHDANGASPSTAPPHAAQSRKHTAVRG